MAGAESAELSPNSSSLVGLSTGFRDSASANTFLCPGASVQRVEMIRASVQGVADVDFLLIQGVLV